MITKRLLILLVVVVGGMAATFILPKSYSQPYGIILTLPSYLGDWTGKSQEVTEKEKTVLGKGTEFARSYFQNPYTEVRNYGIQTSIVLSGHDMSNSIHRPERCLTAQGWNLLDKTQTEITVPNAGKFPVTELYCTKVIRDDAGKEHLVKSITCYWFAGEHELTANHWYRAFTDNRDRFMKGVNQRWAYVLLTGNIPATAPENEAKAREWTEKTMRKFITQLAPKIHGPGLKYQ